MESYTGQIKKNLFYGFFRKFFQNLNNENIQTNSSPHCRRRFQQTVSWRRWQKGKIMFWCWCCSQCEMWQQCRRLDKNCKRVNIHIYGLFTITSARKIKYAKNKASDKLHLTTREFTSWSVKISMIFNRKVCVLQILIREYWQEARKW